MKVSDGFRLGAVSSVAAVTAVFGVTGYVSAAPAPAPASATVTGFNAQAYGSFLSGFGGSVKSGPTAFTQLGCTTNTGIANHNSTAAVTLGAVGSVGAVTSSTSTTAVAGGVRDNASATIGQTKLLGGLVSASAIHATAAAKNVGTTRSTSSGASLVELKVAGRSVTVKPNLTMKLTAAGASTPFATAVFNEQTVSRSATRIAVRERAIDIAVTAANPLRLPVGSRIVLGEAQAGLAPGVQGLLGGNGYGTKATVGSTIKSGATAYLAQSCLGSSGTNRITSVSNPLVHAGAVVTHIAGTIGATTSNTRTTNQISNVNLLGGAVTADAITSAAHAHAANGQVSLDSTGSGFTHLRVLGAAVNGDNVAPNTTMALPGIGTLTLRKTDTSNTGGLHRITVTMAQLVITTGANAGTTVMISGSSASIRR